MAKVVTAAKNGGCTSLFADISPQMGHRSTICGAINYAKLALVTHAGLTAQVVLLVLGMSTVGNCGLRLR